MAAWPVPAALHHSRRLIFFINLAPMPWYKLIFLGIIIGSNNLAASLALGALGQHARQWRIIFVFGFFEFCIPLLGIWLGQRLATMIEQELEWLSIGLLLAMAVFMIYSGVRHRPTDEKIADRVTSWAGLVVLAAGLSLDNLIIGFSLGLGSISALLVAGVIAFFSMLFTWIGIQLGDSSRKHWEQYAEIGAGLLLIFLVIAKIFEWI